MKGVRVERQNVSFCILTRRLYPLEGDSCPVKILSAAAKVPLNGAKCRMCTPCKAGEEAEKALATIPRAAPNWPGPFTQGIDICSIHQPWEDTWQQQFDDAMGAELARQRHAIVRMAADVALCMRSFERLRALSAVWTAPSPLGICVRGQLGEAKLLGSAPRQFSTFTRLLSASSVVLSMSDRFEWEATGTPTAVDDSTTTTTNDYGISASSGDSSSSSSSSSSSMSRMERTGARNGSDGVSSTSIRKRGGKNHHNHRSNSSSSESSSGKWWTSSSRSRSIRNSRRMKRRRSAGAGAGGAGGGDGGRSKFNSSLRRASSRSSGRGKRVLRRLLHEADTEVTLKSTQESALTQLLGAAWHKGGRRGK
ncbi:hypothetical protein CLOM_g8629 [Closterium sp. NIES-68]|nr:hypothetical protein CLOM_g8629 [Closterium sp. NIES-68]